MIGSDKPRQFFRPNPLLAGSTRYDTDAHLMQELDQTTKPPFYVYTLDLSVAPGAAGSPFQQGSYEFQNGFFKLPTFGRGFVPYGFATASDNNAPNTTFYMQIGVQRPDVVWDGKHGRGYRGDFSKLWLSWTAQAGVSVKIYVFQFDDVPYFNGENSSELNPSVNDTVTTGQTSVTLNVQAQAVGVNPARKQVTIQNNTGGVVRFGDSTVSATTGISVSNGGIYTWNNKAALYCYPAATGKIDWNEEI